MEEGAVLAQLGFHFPACWVSGQAVQRPQDFSEKFHLDLYVLLYLCK